MIATAPEQVKVVEFRYQWLVSAGYTKKNAEKIAQDVTIDWHTAYDLRQRCADERLCMRILFGK
jgi:hypothetical protein